MFTSTHRDRRPGASLNGSRRTILALWVAVIAAVLVPTLADATPVSRPRTSAPAQAAHKKRCKKATHRKTTRRHGKRHVHCIKNKKPSGPNQGVQPPPTAQGPSTGKVPDPAVLPLPTPPTTPIPGGPPPGPPTLPNTPPPPPPLNAAAHMAQAPQRLCWGAWASLFPLSSWFGASINGLSPIITYCYYEYGYVRVFQWFVWTGDRNAWQYWFRTNIYPNGYWESPGD